MKNAQHNISRPYNESTIAQTFEERLLPVFLKVL
jgi:hypothetical protein